MCALLETPRTLRAGELARTLLKQKEAFQRVCMCASRATHRKCPYPFHTLGGQRERTRLLEPTLSGGGGGAGVMPLSCGTSRLPGTTRCVDRGRPPQARRGLWAVRPAIRRATHHPRPISRFDPHDPAVKSVGRVAAPPRSPPPQPPAHRARAGTHVHQAARKKRERMKVKKERIDTQAGTACGLAQS